MEVPGFAGLSAAGVAYCVLAVALGAFVKGYSGFGASMLWVTSLALILPPRDVVPTVLMLEVVSSAHLVPQVWREVQWRSMGVLLLGTWAGTPFGIFALTALPPDVLRAALGVMVLLAVIPLARGFRLAHSPGTAATFATGVAAGGLNGSMAIVGPPVILFYFSSPIGVAVGRASMIAYFLGTDTVATAMLWGQGLVAREDMWRTLILLPVLFAGVALGHRRFIATSDAAFKRFCLGLLSVLAAALIARTVM